MSTFVGVGLGPGDATLITLKALDCLQKVPVIICPRSNDYGLSRAWESLRSLDDFKPCVEQERVFCTFPMSKDSSVVQPAIHQVIETISPFFDKNLDIAFITTGDPFLFSTFIYLQEQVKILHPDVNIEVISGVSSIAAVSAAAKIPLADGQERVAIIPGTYGCDDLPLLLDLFDTILIMKIGGALPNIIKHLKKMHLLDKAIYVSHATMPHERVIRDISTISERGDCFAMLMIAKKQRSGLLVGNAS